MLIISIIIIAIISFALAYRSLLHLEKMEEVKKVRKELKRGKVIFRQDSSSSGKSR